MTRKKAPAKRERERWSPSDKAQVYAAALGNPVWPLVGAAGAVAATIGFGRVGGAVGRLLMRERAPLVSVASPDLSGLFGFLAQREAAEREEREGFLSMWNRRQAENDAERAARDAAFADQMAAMQAALSARDTSPGAAPAVQRAPGTGVPPSFTFIESGSPLLRPGASILAGIDAQHQAAGGRSSLVGAEPLRAFIPHGDRDEAAHAQAAHAPLRVFPAPDLRPGGRPGSGNIGTALGRLAGGTVHSAVSGAGGFVVGAVESVPRAGLGVVDFAAGVFRQEKRTEDQRQRARGALDRIFPETENVAFEVGRSLPSLRWLFKGG